MNIIREELLLSLSVQFSSVLQCEDWQFRGGCRIRFMIYIIHPKLRIRECRFGSGKGVGLL